MELKDVIHYYIGCDCRIDGDNDIWHITGVENTMFRTNVYAFTQDLHTSFDLDMVTLILRPIDSLTHEEIEQLFSILGWRKDMSEVKRRICLFTAIENEDYECENDDGFLLYKESVKMIPYLLSLGIDIFGLIESGIAININK